MNIDGFCYFCEPAWEHICREAAFSDREADILRLALRGTKIGTIARRLAVSPSTVKKNIRRLSERFGGVDRLGLLTLVFDIHNRWLHGDSPPIGRCPKRDP
jgi:DNA-binding NarL/FixJ family response regulator